MAGNWSSLTLSGNLKDLSSSLDGFRWIVINQTRLRDDNPNAWRFTEDLLFSQLGYDITKYASVWLGYVHDWIHPLDRTAYQESRPYEDLMFVFPAGDLTIDSRTRLEQRINQTTGNLGVRLRQMFMLHQPLDFIDPSLSLYVGDEILGYLNANSFGPTGFSENRAMGGFNYKLTSQLAFDLGYLGQYARNNNASAIFTQNIFANVSYKF